jgi:hypothetical protein
VCHTTSDGGPSGTGGGGLRTPKKPATENESSDLCSRRGHLQDPEGAGKTGRSLRWGEGEK